MSSSDPNYIRIEDNQDAFREIIRRERTCGAVVLKVLVGDDIRRWKMAEQLPEVTGDCYGMDFSGTNTSEFFNRNSIPKLVYGDKNIIGSLFLYLR